MEAGRTLTAVIKDALRLMLSRRTPSKPSGPARLPVAGAGAGDGGVLQPGVDLDDSASLLELTESGDASR